ncbi:YqhG family protein [Paenibacillus mendelii]|uniref:YqhG family protein n=1 Tax=Paenibacillus mendelii TaxID=206163 RepID=A0ABV6JAS2_9BACL|nr:YqhG family protein [Paenibacillus mendelii]MCQ6563132.1 YqhG family protein [Paenibacillus mendelii]
MNDRQVHKFVQRYLETTECRIMEKSPAHFLVKLSPKADRDLTNRPFYWGFVDRTGAEPETMSMLLVTDKNKYDESKASEKGASVASSRGGVITGAVTTQPAVNPSGIQATPGASGPSGATQPAGGIAGAAEAAIGRSMGFIHGTLNTNVRVPREDLHYGSRKLEQLFESAKANGSYLCLFQEPDKKNSHPLQSTAYTAWLGVNYKVEFACDMKREELHSFGVSLATGQCAEQFYDRLQSLRMTPRLPPNVHTAKNGLTLNKATAIAEQTLERKLRSYDYEWADAAADRLQLELATIQHYYEPLLESPDEEVRRAVAEQFKRRQDEIRWQYEPRVTVSAINCGIFYLQGIG